MPLFRDGAQRASRHHEPDPSPIRPNDQQPATLSTLLRRGAVAVGLGLLLSTQAAGLVSAHAEDHDHDPSERVSLKSSAGQQVKDRSITLTAPARGEFAFAEQLFADGTAQELLLETDAAGRVFATHLGDDRVTAALETQRAASRAADRDDAELRWREAQDDGNAMPRGGSECGSRSYYSYSWKIPTYKWMLNTPSIPYHLRSRSNGTALVVKEFKDAVSNITGADNSCGRGDYISASHSYLGWTRRSNGISSGGSCTGGDGYSVVNFGYLPSGIIGMACAYGWSGGYAREGDVRLNLRTHWETHVAYCNSETMIQAAATHEFGHVFGLGHAYGSPQTMNPYIPNCSQAPSTLGMGDLAGFERKY